MRTDPPSGGAREPYNPRIDPHLWDAIEPFVVACVDLAVQGVPYPRDILLTAVTHHVAWVRLRAGADLRVEHVFSRSMIGASVADMTPATPSTQGRRRSVLMRVAETLGAIDTPVRLPQLRASSSTTPYSPADRAVLRTWASLQGNMQMRSSLRALLALGFGAGLLTRELCEVRGDDVADHGEAVRVVGDRERIVPVAQEWRTELDALATAAPEPTATLFRPYIPYTRNTVVDIVRRAQGATVVTTQRMRASWIVDRLTEGMPLHMLLAAAGVRSLDAFVRYEQFLPHARIEWHPRRQD